MNKGLVIMDEDEVVGKTCTKCGECKLLSDFAKSAKHLYGCHSTCKACKSLMSRDWYLTNKERINEKSRKWHTENQEKSRQQSRDWYANNREQAGINSRERQFRVNFGITVEWYENKLLEQNGVCELCKGTCFKRLSVDHEHSTGIVRGLLCSKCNMALERLDSVAGWADTAKSYIEKYRLQDTEQD